MKDIHAIEYALIALHGDMQRNERRAKREQDELKRSLIELTAENQKRAIECIKKMHF